MLRANIYPSLPSFRKEDWSIASEDLPVMCRAWKYPRTIPQLKGYMSFWDSNFEGRAPFGVMLGLLESAHLAGPLLRECIKDCDKNHDSDYERRAV